MKYFVVVNDDFGRDQGWSLIKQLIRLDIRAEFVGVGFGTSMSDELDDIHFNSISLQNMDQPLRLKQQLEEFFPDALILIGYSKVHKHLSSYARKLGIKVFIFSSPISSYHKKSSLPGFYKSVDMIYSTLPLEFDLLRKKGLNVLFVGNPVIDSIKNYNYDPQFIVNPNETTIAVILDESGKSIQACARMLRKLASSEIKHKYLAVCQKALNAKDYEELNGIQNVSVFFDKTYDVVKRSNAAIVLSDIATLETALLNCPQVVIHCSNLFSRFTKMIVGKKQSDSLVNSILDRKIVEEFECTETELILDELNKILNNHQYCASMLQNYQVILDRVGAESPARKTAKSIVDFLEE